MAEEHSAKPSDTFIEKTKQEMQRRYNASRAIVDSKKEGWTRWKNLYKTEQAPRRYTWESNLVIPKANYIINTIHPQIMTTLFRASQWVTFKNSPMPDVRSRELEAWFVWFCEKIVGLYMVLSELFKGSPIYGSSFAKMTFKDNVPQVEYIPIEDFYPDATHNKPGDVDGMKWAFHKFPREFRDLEKARVFRIRQNKIKVPMMDENGVPQIDGMGNEMLELDSEGKEIRQTIPTPYDEPLYFNLDKIWSKHAKPRNENTVSGTNVHFQIPKLSILEGWGEIDTNFVGYDVQGGNYSPGKYEEYIVTAVLEGDIISEIIRCEPSTLKYFDPYKERDVYLKPFISSIYNLNEGEFYGTGSIEPVESIIAEQEEHHNMVMDNHKRAVFTILSVLERSGLQRRDLGLSPFNIWRVKNHGDVVPIKFPDIDTTSFTAINQLLDRELDRTTGATQLLQGVPLSKRTTAKEFQGSISEATKRFNVFVQMADRLTMRPLVFKLLLMASNMPFVQSGRQFETPGGAITVSPEELQLLQEITFAATGAEDEMSKYNKQERMPKLLQGIGGILKATNGEWVYDLPMLLKEIETTYDWKGIADAVKPNQRVIPLEVLKQVTPKEMIPVIQQLIQKVFQAMEEKKKGGGKAPPTELPGLPGKLEQGGQQMSQQDGPR